MSRSERRDSGSLERELRRKLSESGRDPYVLHRLGTVLYRQGKVLEARQMWDEAAARDPNLAAADLSVARELMTKGNLAAAEVALRSAEQRKPDDPHLYVARGALALLEKNLPAAEKALQRAYELAPKLTTVNIGLGRFYERRRDLVAAATFYRNATELTPRRPQAWLLLAGVRFQQNQIEETLKLLRHAEQLDPDIPPAEAVLAGFYLSMRDRVGALKWQQQAVRRQPDNVDLRRSLAEVQIGLRLNEQARQELQEVLKKGEDVKSLLLLARLESQGGRLDQAALLYRRALELDADNLIANNNLAMLLIRQGKSADEAVELAKAALQATPKNTQVLGTYGCALWEAGQTEEAQKILPQAVRRNPGDAWLRYAYGKLLRAQQQPEAAHDQLEGCLLLDPDFPRKSEVQTLLKELASRKK